MSWDGSWDERADGVVRLPGGSLVRGRGLRRPRTGPDPQFALHLLGRDPGGSDQSVRWVRWPDFRLPADPADLRDALTEALHRCATERVEIACGGGRGRTGTALACLAVLDGVPAAQAVAWVRTNYHRGAVETPGQRRLVARFPGAGGDQGRA